jgi:hypothetical protein
MYSEQLRVLLYKKSLAEASLIQEMDILKKCLEEMKNAYNTMSLANIQKDKTIAQLAIEQRRYMDILIGRGPRSRQRASIRW